MGEYAIVGQKGAAKLIRDQVTRPFELYMTLSPGTTKSAAVAAANAVAKWVAGEEGRIFLKDAPVF